MGVGTLEKTGITMVSWFDRPETHDLSDFRTATRRNTRLHPRSSGEQLLQQFAMQCSSVQERPDITLFDE